MGTTNLVEQDLQVTVIDEVEEVDDREFVDSVAEQLQLKVLTHLKNSPEYFKSVDLKVKLRKCTARFYLHEVRWNFWTETSGTINQKEFLYVSQSKGSKYDNREPIRLTTAWMISNLIISIRRSLSEDYSYESDYVQATYHKCTKDAIFKVTDNILVSIEKCISRSVGNSSKLWKKWLLVRWVVAAIAFFLFTILMYFVDVHVHHQKWEPSLLGGYALCTIQMSLAIFWLVHCLGYLMMPADFYHKETAGLNALKKAGTDSILGVRIIALIISCVIIFAFIAVWYAIIYRQSPF